jgi:anti-sigma regulatory factor (Ser/Thr protein kinase)
MGPMSIPLLESEEAGWFFDEPASARGAAAALGRRIGLSERRTAEVAVAVTEAATNLAKHAVAGALVLRVVHTGPHTGLEFLTMDSGPGIEDVAAALRDGMSTVGTLGIGLGAVARLADVFDVHSLPGRGTVLVARFWPHEEDGTSVVGPAEPVVAGLTRAISGEQVCGDAWAVRSDPLDAAARARLRDAGAEADGESVTIMLCDGLGHGPLAMVAAQAAVLAFRGARPRDPEAMIGEIHSALRGSRGAAVAIVRIEPQEGRLLYCGVGNIDGTLITPESRVGLTSYPGIVGHQMRGLRTFEHALAPGGSLVLHSDGLTKRWTPQELPGFFEHSPIVMAAQLMREAGVRRDDASVVVAKGLW